jgi:hypothetical protein
MQTLDTAATRPRLRRDYTSLARQPLFLAFVLGCGVSMLGSGRLTIRLIADGTLSFAFVPLCEFLGFIVSYSMVGKGRPQGRPLPGGESAEGRPLPGGESAGAGSFAQAVDDFFATNQPWLWWSIALIVAAAIVPASRLGSLLGPILITAPIPIVLSGALEWRWARRVLRRTRSQAAIGLVVQRAVAWSAATAYFFGVALTTRDFLYTFVEMGQEISNWVGTML